MTRNYSMINLHESNVRELGLECAILDLQSDELPTVIWSLAPDSLIWPSIAYFQKHCYYSTHEGRRPRSDQNTCSMLKIPRKKSSEYLILP